MPPLREDPESPIEGLAARLRATGKVAAAGARLAARRALGREGDPDLALGESIARELDRMKGIAMKAGQVLSYFEGMLPVSTHEALRVLQTGVTAMPYPRVVEVLAEEFGRPPEELFESFEREPAAAASIGQVHRARFEGRDVAVKIQYPHLAETIEADFRRLRPFSRLVSLGTAVDGPGIADDIAAHLAEECDYRAEAASQEWFREAWSDDPRIAIPAVVPERSSRRVLTTAWAEGDDFYAFAERAGEPERHAAAATLLRFAFGSLFGLGRANADPHPGNYVFPPGAPRDAPIVFLDFGCVHRFGAAFLETERNLARAVLDDRPDEFRRRLDASGLVASPRGFDYDLQWRMQRLQYAPFGDPEFEYSTRFVREVMELSGPSNPNLRRLAVTDEWVWYQRLVWGLHAVLARLGARGPFDELFREMLDGASPARRPAVPGDRPLDDASTRTES